MNQMSNEAAERGVLGAALLDADKVMTFAVNRKKLLPDAFYHPPHALLWKVLMTMADEKRPIDVLTVAEKLGQTGLEKIGGTTYLNGLLDSIPTAAHAEYYVDILLEWHTIRKISMLEMELKEAVSQGELSECQRLNGLIQAELTYHATSEVEPFEIWSLSDIQKYIPDPKNYIAGNGWLRRGAGMLLTGGTGIGKSILAEQISLYVAAGTNILGCIAVKQSFHTLHIQAENDQDTIKRDTESIIKNIQPEMNAINIEEHFHICHAYGLTGNEFISWLNMQCIKFKPDLITIDPYQAYIPGEMDINSSACFLSWIKPINALIRDFNCALVLVAHTPKPRDREGWTARESVYMAAGSSAISNWARTSAELTQVGQEDFHFRLRFGKNAERTGIINDDGHIVRDLFIEHSKAIKEPYWAVSESQAEPIKSKYRDEVISLALAHPSMSQREIAKQIGCSIGIVSKWYPVEAKNQ
jgi:hypothetical protein